MKTTLMLLLLVAAGATTASAQNVAGVGLSYVAVERESGGLTSGAGAGGMVGFAVLPNLLIVGSANVGVSQFASDVYRIVGNADAGARYMMRVTDTAAFFGEVAASTIVLEEPAREENIRFGATVGAGLDFLRTETKSLEINVRKSWFDSTDEWRVTFGLRWHPGD